MPTAPPAIVSAMASVLIPLDITGIVARLLSRDKPSERALQERVRLTVTASAQLELEGHDLPLRRELGGPASRQCGDKEQAATARLGGRGFGGRR